MDSPNSLNEDFIEDLDNLQVSTNSLVSPQKNSYKSRKLENKLKKYEFQLKATEKISRLEQPTKVLT